jgi:hypothetical protein
LRDEQWRLLLGMPQSVGPCGKYRDIHDRYKSRGKAGGLPFRRLRILGAMR